uniref:Uncharacterized protein n=1 Tax=Cyprinus carpio TaxID=7962 RepID=A0A8C1YKD2_CYPCA
MALRHGMAILNRSCSYFCKHNIYNDGYSDNYNYIYNDDYSDNYKGIYNDDYSDNYKDIYNDGYNIYNDGYTGQQGQHGRTDVPVHCQSCFCGAQSLLGTYTTP